MQLNVKKLGLAVPTPAYGREGDAALDLRANIESPLTLQPGERADLGCGLAFAIPAGHVGLVVPRGGMGRKGLALRNTVGVIDSNYRGEVMMPLINNGAEAITLAPQERIMQLLVMPVATCTVNVVDDLDDTIRGEGRYGSSGNL